VITNDFYSQANHGPFQTYDLGNFTLEEGGTIRGCQLAYATHGKLNKKKRQRDPHPLLVLRHQQDF